MKTRWKLFTYPLMDEKAAEAMLNRQAAQGWRLDKVWFRLLARFVPAETPVCYCIDWTDPNGAEDADYVALCAQAGWTLRQPADHWNIYEAPAGTPPIQTDTQLEYRRFRDKVLSWLKLSAILELAALVLLGIICLGQPEGLAFPLTLISNSTTLGLLLFLFPLFLVGDLLWMGRLVLRLFQWRAAARAGEPMPTPGPVSAAIAGLLCLLPPVWYVISVLALAVDSLNGRGRAAGLVAVCLSAAVVLRILRRSISQRHRIRLFYVLTLVIMLPAFAVQALFGPVTADLMVEPPLSRFQVLPLSQSGGVDESADLSEILTSDSVGARSEHCSFFLGHSGWEEEEFDLITLIPQAPPTDLELYQKWDAWTARWTWLADGVQRALGGGEMAPLPGYEDVWADGELYLIRRGNTLLRADTPLPAEQWLPRAIQALEEVPS